MGFSAAPPPDTTDARVREVYDKTCICNHLGNGALIELEIGPPSLPVAVCPGPNIAHFDREYTLREMVDHIYGRGPSLVPASRPHMFAKELAMNVDEFVKRARALVRGDARALAALFAVRSNLESGIAYYRALVRERAFDGENLPSLAAAVDTQAERLEQTWLEIASRTAA